MSTHPRLHFDRFVSKTWSSPRSSPVRWRGKLDHTCKYTICRTLLPRAATSQKYSHTDGAQPATASNVDIHLPYSLSEESIQDYQASGFVRLQNVFSATTLAHYRPTMSLEVAKADKTPLEEDSDYQKAFTQITNLWAVNKQVEEFVLGHKLGQIASELMGVRGVRVYHDQALNKEPHGGYTPWHCDGFYWPVQSDKIVTAWIPLQDVPLEMGPLQFAVGSHKQDLGRDKAIGGEAHKQIDASIKQGGFDIVNKAFRAGDVSFHSGWTFHQAGGNNTDKPREVFTIIFMDIDMLMAEPINSNQRLDHGSFYRCTQVRKQLATRAAVALCRRSGKKFAKQLAAFHSSAACRLQNAAP